MIFIGIDGHGGSGKSTLATELGKALNAEVIHTDDFASFENYNNWWPQVVDKVFKPIQDGATKLSYPRSKWWESHNPDPVVDQPVTQIMIIEGVSALRKEFRNYIDFGIYVDTHKEICLQRGLERDRGKDGKSDNEILSMWDKWLSNEDEYIARDGPSDYADILIDGTKSTQEAIQKISSELNKKCL